MFTKRAILKITLISLLIVVMSAFSFFDLVPLDFNHPSGLAFADLTQQIFFQGRVKTNAGTTVTGSHSFVFNLYAASTGGTTLWTETQTLTADASGIISCYLGSSTVFPSTLDFNSTYYLSINVDGDGEMSPRIKIVPSAASLNADRLDGLNSLQFLRADTADTMEGTLTFSAVTTDIATATGEHLALIPGGNVGIGTTSPGQKLSIAGTLGIIEGGTSPTYYNIIQGGDQSANITYTLPTAQGDSGTYLKNDGSGTLNWATVSSGTIDHGGLSGLTDDDHTQYALLAGRSGGQTLIGGTASGDDFTFSTTSNTTKGSYIFSEMTTAGFLKNTAEGVVSGGNSLAAGDLPSAIDASKIANGLVSNTEFQYLDGVTSAIQTQLDSKATSSLTSGYIFVGNSSNVATGVAMSGDVAITNAGVTAVGDDSHSHTSSTLPSGTSYLGSTIDLTSEVTGILPIANGGTAASTAAGARTNLGLGSIATQDANNVSITGGSVTGITDLAIADGGTAASTAAGARTNLELGSIATQDANNVSISGGSITGITDLAVADGGTGTSTGSITATDALTFTAGGTNQNITLVSSGTGKAVLKPGTDSTTAIQLQNAAGTSVLNVDTSSSYVGIGTTAPSYNLDVSGNIRATGTIYGNFASIPGGGGTATLDALTVTGNTNLATTTGSVGIGTTSPSQALELGADKWLSFEGATANDFETTIQVTDPTADRTITLPNESGTLITSTGVSGTENYVAKFTGTSTLGNSVIYDNNTNVGIGTSDPSLAKFTLQGKTTIADTLADPNSDGTIYLGKSTKDDADHSPENFSQYLRWDVDHTHGDKMGWFYFSAPVSMTSLQVRNKESIIFGSANNATDQTIQYDPDGGTSGGAFIFSDEGVFQSGSPAYLTFSKSGGDTLYSLEFNPDATPNQTLRLVKKATTPDASIIPLFEFDTAGSFSVFDSSGNKNTLISQGSQWQQEFDNLIFNGSFESFSGGTTYTYTGMGTTQFASSIIDGWDVLAGGIVSRIYAPSFGATDSASVKAGFAAVNVEDTSATARQGIQQEVKPFELRKTIGKQVTLSVYAKKATSGSTTTSIGFEAQDSAGNMISVTNRKDNLAINNSTFTLISYTFTVPTNTYRLFIRLFGADASNVSNTCSGGIIYDGVTLVEGTLVSPFRASSLSDTGSQTLYGNLQIAKSGQDTDQTNYGVSPGGNLGVYGKLTVGQGIEITGGSMTLGRGGAYGNIWAYPMGSYGGTTAYKYTVTSVNSSGIESLPREVYVSNGSSSLSTSNYIMINWMSDPNATSYRIYGRSPASGFGRLVTGLTTCSYSDTGSASPDVNYQPPTFYQSTWTPPGSLTMEGGLRVGTGSDPRSEIGAGSAVSFGNAFIVGNTQVAGDLYLGTGSFTHSTGNSDIYVTGNLQVDGVIFGTLSTGAAAPTNATYITQTPDGTLTSEQALSNLSLGILKNTNNGVLAIATEGQDYYKPAGTDVADADIVASITRDTEWDTWDEHPALTSAYILVGSAVNKAAGVALSGDATLANTGALTIATGAVTSAKILDSTIANADISDTAAIAWAKINKTGAVASDVSAISSTLNSGKILVGNASNVATAVAMSGDVTIDNAGATSVADSITRDTEWNTVAKLETATGADLITEGEAIGDTTPAAGTFTNLTINKEGTATSGANYDSNDLLLKGSYWDGANPQDANISLFNAVTGNNLYKLSILDKTGTNEIASLTQAGALQIDGALTIGATALSETNLIDLTDAGSTELHTHTGLTPGVHATAHMTGDDKVYWNSLSKASADTTSVTSQITSDISTHAALTATHGVTGALVGTTDTQTLTNKTISIVSNGLTVGTNQLVVSGGNVGIGTTSPGAFLHLKAGTASTAPLKFTSGELLATQEIGVIEFVTDDYYASITTQTGGVFTSQYPPVQDSNYVKATTAYGGMPPDDATDPANPLTGAWAGNTWLSTGGATTNQRFHIDLGSAKIITRIYYENCHDGGYATNAGVQNFTFWGSNNVNAFAELTYGTDTGWTQLTTGVSSFDQHTGSDVADPKYITVTNGIAYRYYAFKFANNYGNTIYMGVRRIELLAGDLLIRKGIVLNDGTKLTSGRIPFATTNGRLTDDAGLFWNNSDKRVGIGSTSPASKLDVNGTITGTGLTVNGTVSGSGFTGWDTSAADDLTNTLASGKIFVGNASNVATAVAMSGDVTIDNAGATTVADSITRDTEWNTLVKINNATTDADALSDSLTSAYIFVGSVLNKASGVALSGDAAISNTGALTIANGAVTSAKILDSTIANADISDTAAIAWAKINKTGAVASDVGALGNSLTGTHILVGNASNVATDVAMSGDATMANNGALTIANNAITSAKIANDTIINEDINSEAGIGWTKISKTGAVASDVGALSTTLASTKILVGNVSNVATAVTLSGDATLDNVGALTIANNAITAAKLAADAVETAKIKDANVTSSKILDGTIANADVSDTAAIAWTKISKSGAVASDVGALTNTLTSGNILVGNVSNVATGVNMSGDVTIDNAGATTVAASLTRDSEWDTLAKINTATTDTDALANDLSNTNIFVGNISNKAAGVALSGDATLANTGALTIANGAVTSGKILDSTIANADISDTAAIAWAKINKTGAVASDVGALGNSLTGTHILVGNASNVATDVAMSGDATLSNAGALTIANNAITSAKIVNDTIINEDINSAAAIAWTKISKSGAVASDVSAISSTLNSGKILVGNVSNVATAVTMSGDVTIDNAGATSVADSITRDTEWNSLVKINAATTDADALSDSLTSAYIFVGSVLNKAAGVALSGDATINNTGALTIANSAITNAKVASDAAIAWTKISKSGAVASDVGALGTALTETHILVGNVSGVATDVAMSGDATLSNAGALTIANNAITAAKLAADAVETAKIKDANVTSGKLASDAVTNSNVANAASIAWTKISKSGAVASDVGAISSTLTSGYILVGNATNVATGVTMGGDVTISNTGVTDIAANAVGANEIASSGVTLGSYTNANITVDVDGRLTSATSGTTPVTDHGGLTGLADDDHTQYALLAGRSGGQTLKGGTGAGESLTFSTTAHTTKGSYIFSEMTTAGFLKNNVSGAVTGGNSLADSDIPDAITRDAEWDTWAEHPALTSGNILVGNGSNQAASVTMSGDATISNGGVLTIANNAITNAKVAAAAAIDWTKISKTGSSIADLATKSAGDLNSGNLGVALLPTGGNWTLSSNLNLDSNTLLIDQANNRVAIGAASAEATLDAVYTSTGVTTNNVKIIQAYNTGATFNTTASGLTNYAGYLTNTATRSAGANNLTNVALYLSASGAQNNYGLIVDSGYVGINATAPAYRLDVGGDIRATGTIYASASAYPVPTGPGGGGGTTNRLAKWTAANQLGNSGVSDASDAVAITIDSNEQVGIGTTGPVSRLDLNGGSIAMGPLNATGAINFRNDIAVGTAGSVGIGAIDALGNGNNDGLGLYVSDGLKILNGTTAYVTVLNTGNVGIGTTPTTKFHIYGGGTFYHQGASYASLKGYELSDGGNSYRLTTGAAGENLELNVNDVSGRGIFIASTTGNVGIGTTSPGAKLHIYDSQTSDVPIVKLTNTYTANYIQGYHAIAPNMGTNHFSGYVVGQDFSARNAGMMGFNYVGAGSTSNYLYFGGHSVNDAMVITMGGNVGIGTTGPVSRLSVHASNAFNEPYAATIFVGRRPDGGPASLGIGYANNKAWHLDVNSDADLTFHNNDGSWHERMRLSTGGNLGIGGTVTWTGGNSSHLGTGVAVTTYVGNSSVNNAIVRSNSNTEDAWIMNWGDSAIWGIYNRNIDSTLVVAGALDVPANSTAFIGNGLAKAYIEHGSGNAGFAGTITSGLINGQTISSAANFTGSMKVNGPISVYEGAASSSYPIVIKQTSVHQYLSVESTGTYEAMTRYYNPTAGNWYTGIRTGDDTSAYHIYSSTYGNDTFRISTAATVYMPGNVGIGTTAPAYKLQVTQSAADWTVHANGTGGYGLLGTGSTYAGYFQGPVYTTSNYVGAGTGLTGTASSLTSGATNFVNGPDGDRNAATKLPTTSGHGVRFDFVGAGTANGGGNYSGLMTYAPWDGTSASTGDASYQISFSSPGTNGSGVPYLSIRSGINSTWNSWYTMLNSGNYNSYALPLSGGTVSGITTHANQLFLTGGWSQNGAPYHAAFQIQGTYPSMEFRSSSSNSVWLYHMSANGYMNWYNDPASQNGVNWSNMMQLSPGGNLNVVGVLTKGSGSFLIDHPLDPKNKVLRHSFVESPDMKNIYDGIATLNEKGEITVELPNYFEALNENFRYQITPVGKPALLYVKEEIKDNKFVIAGGESGMKVSWQVTGVRKDAFAKKYPVVVEEEKGFGDTQKGVYLHPDSFPAQNTQS